MKKGSGKIEKEENGRREKGKGNNKGKEEKNKMEKGK